MTNGSDWWTVIGCITVLDDRILAYGLLIMKSDLSVTVMVTVWSHGLNIEGRLFVLRHGTIVKC